MLSATILVGLIGCVVESSFAAEGLFRDGGVPFFKQHCVKCHGEKEQEAGLRLDVIQDDAALLKSRKVMEKVVDRLLAGDMPPAEEPRPKPAETGRVIDLIETVFEKADRAAKPDPGRVTMRRLNKVEYANTVRDLVGIDFDPTEDFPSDDIGYGFDNIGDVLTLPPLLMERYLSAAESIMQRAIPNDLPKTPERHTGARYTEPAGRSVSEKRFRELRPEKTDAPRESGPMHTQIPIPANGEFVAKAFLWAEGDPEQKIEVALIVGNGADARAEGIASDEEIANIAGSPAVIKQLQPLSILKKFEITTREEKKKQLIEISFNTKTDFKRLALAVMKWPAGAEPPKVFVDYIDLQGPKDTRPNTEHRLLAEADAVPGKEKPPLESIRTIFTRFAQRAYRRPVTESEIQRLVGLYEANLSESSRWQIAAQKVMTAVLVSPKFLFRVEQDERPAASEIRPLDQFQLASRLSYFLWSTMPDDELRELARKGELISQWEPQVRRMLKSPKAEALVDQFAMQWLQLKRINSVSPDPKLFNGFNENLRRAMLTETRLFLKEIIQADHSVLDLYDGKFTFLNESLANHYGIADTAGNWAGQKADRPNGQPIRGRDFVRVELPMAERGGLLTHASLLTVTSNPTRTSPVKRGRWVLEQVLGTPPPAPPANVPELKEDEQARLTGSLRQRMEQHRANPNCANCHARMDPIGFAFEHYDAVGRYRQKDGDFPIETAGVLPGGREIHGPTDLKQVLREKRNLVYRNLAEKLLTYAIGRGLDYSDRPTLARISAEMEGNDKFSQLVLLITNSDPFRLRRGLDEVVAK